MIPALVLLLAAGTCPVRAPAAGGLGLAAVGKVPAGAAMRENAEGKKLYRQERWPEARQKYQAALAADPEFLGARLNLACAYSREGRYAEAAEESAKLIRTAYVPWQREVREAFDLGILQDQEVYARVTGAMSEAARGWGDLVARSVLFIGRTKPPVKVTGEGSLLLSLNQEVFAWSPETGHYLQVTAEDGHVLGFVRSADRRRVAYLLGGRLVREPGRPAVLRGLVVRVLEIATMALGPSVALPGDATRVELGFAASPEMSITRSSGQASAFRVGEAGLEPIARLQRLTGQEFVVLSPTGVQPGAAPSRRDDCRFDLVSKASPAGLWQVEVRSRGKPFLLDARYGAGLPGLPFPDDSLPPAAAAAAKTPKHDKP